MKEWYNEKQVETRLNPHPNSDHIIYYQGVNSMAKNKIPRTCDVTGCDLPARSLIYCNRHYNRWYRCKDKSQVSDEIFQDRVSGNTRGPRNHHFTESVYRQHFWSYVTIGKPDECWLWTAGTEVHGYGRISYQGNPVLAHRMAWQIANQREAVLDVLHSCDNPPCVNPAHLHEGTQADNMAEMIARGRQRHLRGEEHQYAQLTDDAVREIRQQWVPWQKGLAQSFADKYGTSASAVRHAATRASWRHLD